MCAVLRIVRGGDSPYDPGESMKKWGLQMRLAAVGLWLGLNLIRAEAADGLPPEGRRSSESEGAKLVASTEAGWPQFRGVRRDGKSEEKNLLGSWPEGGPPEVWSVTNVGFGYSSPILAGERLFITGDVGEELQLFSFDLQGGLLWKATNGMRWVNPYPGARSSPTYSEGLLYHENAHGRLTCFEAGTGKEIWAVDLLKRFKGETPTWGLSEGVVVDERAVYATPGGREALMVALDKKTGEVLWKSEPLYDSEGDKELETASYVSPIFVQLGDRRLLVGCSQRHLFCIDAETGIVQWRRRVPTAYSVLAMMPTLVGNGVFMTAPHGKGGHLFELVAPSRAGDTIGFKEVWHSPLDTCQGGVVAVDGTIFGSFYPGRKGWAAVDGASGEVLYSAEFVKGSVTYGDDRLYALSEDGWMRLLEPTEKEFAVRGEFRLAEAKENDAWAHPVIYRGRLHLRYHETLRCYDIQDGARN